MQRLPVEGLWGHIVFFRGNAPESLANRVSRILGQAYLVLVHPGLLNKVRHSKYCLERKRISAVRKLLSSSCWLRKNVPL